MRTKADMSIRGIRKLGGVTGTVLFCFLIIFWLAAVPAWAADLTNVTDTLSGYTAAATASHTVTFTTAADLPKNGKILIAFPPGFNLSDFTLPSSEILVDSIPISVVVSASGQTVILQKKGNNNNIPAGSVVTVPCDNITNISQPGNYAIIVTTTQPNQSDIIDGPNDSATFTITAPELNITSPSPLADGTVGSAYSQTLSASSGMTPYTWSITSGTLPEGLSLNITSGAITGTPTTAGGPTGITFQVTDSASPANSKTKTLSINIQPALVTPSVTVDNKTYDKTAAALISAYFLSGVFNAQDVTLTGGTAQFTALNVNDNITVNISGLTLSGADAANYLLSSTSTNAVASITARPLTVSAVSSSKNYDGTTNSAGTPTITSGSLAGGDTADWTQTFNTSSAGTNKTLTPAGSVNDGNGGHNYSLTLVSIASGIITPRQLSINGLAAADKVYDGTAAAAISAAGASLAGVIAGDNVNLDASAATGVFSNANAGSAKIVSITGLNLSGQDAGNYALPGSTTTATISQAAPVISWAKPADITSGTALSSLQLNARANGIGASDLNGTFSYTPAAGTVLSSGNNQSLRVDFTPLDTTNYNGTSAEVTINVTTSSGGGTIPAGGGGSGGGGSEPKNIVVNVNDFSQTGKLSLNSSGAVQSSVQLQSADRKAALSIPGGTILLDALNKPLTTLYGKSISNIPAPPPQGALILAYDFGPAGARFNPALTLTLSYDAAALPANTSENSLYIAFWDGTQWLKIDGTVDSAAHTISAKLSHFSLYVLMAETLAPIVSPATPSTNLPTPSEKPLEIPLATAIPVTTMPAPATTQPVAEQTATPAITSDHVNLLAAAATTPVLTQTPASTSKGLPTAVFLLILVGTFVLSVFTTVIIALNHRSKL